MGDLLRVLFWTWCGVSATVLVIRLTRRRRRRRSPTPAATALPETPLAEPPSPTPGGQRPARPDAPAHTSLTDPPRNAAVPPPRTPAAARTPVSGIAEALVGVEMPCGLTPAVDPAQLGEIVTEVAFATSEATPAEVHEALLEALGAAGFSVTTEGTAAAVAARDGYRVGVSTVAAAHAGGLGGGPQFASLPGDAAVVLLGLR